MADEVNNTASAFTASEATTLSNIYTAISAMNAAQEAANAASSGMSTEGIENLMKDIDNKVGRDAKGRRVPDYASKVAKNQSSAMNGLLAATKNVAAKMSQATDNLGTGKRNTSGKGIDRERGIGSSLVNQSNNPLINILKRTGVGKGLQTIRGVSGTIGNALYGYAGYKKSTGDTAGSFGAARAGTYVKNSLSSPLSTGMGGVLKGITALGPVAWAVAAALALVAAAAYLFTKSLNRGRMLAVAQGRAQAAMGGGLGGVGNVTEFNKSAYKAEKMGVDFKEYASLAAAGAQKGLNHQEVTQAISLEKGFGLSNSQDAVQFLKRRTDAKAVNGGEFTKTIQGITGVAKGLGMSLNELTQNMLEYGSQFQGQMSVGTLGTLTAKYSESIRDGITSVSAVASTYKTAKSASVSELPLRARLMEMGGYNFKNDDVRGQAFEIMSASDEKGIGMTEKLFKGMQKLAGIDWAKADDSEKFTVAMEGARGLGITPDQFDYHTFNAFDTVMKGGKLSEKQQAMLDDKSKTSAEKITTALQQIEHPVKAISTMIGMYFNSSKGNDIGAQWAKKHANSEFMKTYDDYANGKQAPVDTPTIVNVNVESGMYLTTHTQKAHGSKGAVIQKQAIPSTQQ